MTFSFFSLKMEHNFRTCSEQNMKKERKITFFFIFWFNCIIVKLTLGYSFIKHDIIKKLNNKNI